MARESRAWQAQSPPCSSWSGEWCQREAPCLHSLCWCRNETVHKQDGPRVNNRGGLKGVLGVHNPSPTGGDLHKPAYRTTQTPTMPRRGDAVRGRLWRRLRHSAALACTDPDLKHPPRSHRPSGVPWVTNPQRLISNYQNSHDGWYSLTWNMPRRMRSTMEQKAPTQRTQQPTSRPQRLAKHHRVILRRMPMLQGTELPCRPGGRVPKHLAITSYPG